MEGMHSEWFPHEVRPVRAGVYQRDYGDPGLPALCFCRWDGIQWYAQCDYAHYAAAESCLSLVPAPWRGLTLQEFTERHRDASRAMDRLIWDSKP